MVNFFAKIKIVLKSSLKDFVFNWKQLTYYKTGCREHDFAVLRTRCHMLDKALNNPFFEKGHSMSVYNEAKEKIEKLKEFFPDDPAFIWSQGVLEKFEKSQITGIPEIVRRKAIDYSVEEREIIKKFITSRTSCRNFLQKSISDQIIKNIIYFAVDAPNGCCRQTSRFYVTQSSEIINCLVPNIAGITNFTNIQGLVAVCAESSFYALKDKNLQYVDASLSAENFILAAGMYGIYGTMCNFFHASPKQVASCKKILSIKETENIVMFIAIGYPVYVPEKPSRQSLHKFYKIIR